MEQRKKRTDKQKNVVFYLSLISQIGISMMVPIFLCGYIGILLANKFNKDYLVLLLVILGFAVAFRNVYVLTRGIYAADIKKEQEEQKYFDDLRKEREARLKDNSNNNES